MRIVAIIPARGGSKGIPKKNLRLLAGMPLISYAIKNAQACEEIDDIFVSTDSDEIAEVASNYGVGIVKRGEGLSGDLITLDPVIYDALLKIEQANGCVYDYVVTLQPTSPLLQPGSLSSAIRQLISEQTDCMISVVNKPHLSWRVENGKILPNYAERLNRQELPGNYLETGAFIISRRSLVTEKTRTAGNISVFQVSDGEGIDIDDKIDWVLSETLLSRKRIILRADGYAALGLGHIYNCITLAFAMIEHDVLILVHEDSGEGIAKLKETNLPYRVIRNDSDAEDIIRGFRPDIWVQDRLDTTEEAILRLKELVPRVVTIEDLGRGTKHADAVINALYTEDELSGPNVYSGWRYVCLRDEFQITCPKPFADDVKHVMIMFGGTDPSNFNKIIYDIILHISEKYRHIHFDFVVGIGYDAEKNGLYTDAEKNIYVYPNVARVTRFMQDADLAITSQGRSIFEFACMGVPAIVLSQNKREKMHSFANMEHGFINLGTAEEIDRDMIENTLDWLINTRSVRRNMRELMLKYPLRDGLKRVKDIILGSGEAKEGQWK